MVYAQPGQRASGSPARLQNAQSGACVDRKSGGADRVRGTVLFHGRRPAVARYRFAMTFLLATLPEPLGWMSWGLLAGPAGAGACWPGRQG
jgi:hypothetical protein